MELTFRQGIVRHQTDIAGTATFVRKSGSSSEYIDLVCDEDPLIFTIAHGTNNYLIEESRTVNQAWGPLISTGQTQYLYWDISLLDASLTRGYTLVSPYFGVNEPAAPITIDTHWFDSNTKVMKVWNGSKWLPKLRVFVATYDSNAVLIPRPRGSQVNLVAPSRAGNIVLGKNGAPLRDSDGTFITSESDLISAFTSGENIKLEGMQLYGEALEFIPKFSLVTFDAPGKVKLASGVRPEEIINGIMTSEYFIGEVGNVKSSGLVRNDQWAFAHSQANAPLYCGPNGEVTLTQPGLAEHWYIGYVYDATSIVMDIQKRGASGTSTPAAVGIELQGDVLATGVSSAPITTTLSTTGVVAGTYNNVTVDAKGRVTNGSSLAYLTGNELITVTGDVQGQGTTSLPLTLVNSGVTAGTYTEVTVDSKGRVIAGSNIPFASINPLVTEFNDGSNTTISGWSTKVIQFDSSFVGSSTGLGTVANPGDIVLGLRDSGVTAGTYNSVTVDQKGRVVAASNVNTSQTTDLSGDVIGSGIGSVVTNLSLTGVAPGIYDRVTVDAKGRIVAGTVETYEFPTTLTGDVTGTGTGTISTTLSATGVVAGAYNNFIVGIDGRITSASTVSYDQNVVLSGDVTGSGIGSVTTTLANTGVAPGTYNSVTVDAKGRVTAATVEAPSTPSTTLNGDVTGNGIGTLTTSLSLTGVSAGTYNSVSVDAKGRVTSGTIENYQFPTTLTGDVTGTGTGTFAATLSDTGVAPGTYNSVTVDSKGRVTAASTVSAGGVEYLPDLLDVTITTPTTNQSLLWNGTEWVNQPLDRIVSADSSVIVSDVAQKISHSLNNIELISTTPTITAIGKSSPPEFWYALFDAGTVLQTNVEFHATCIDVDTNNDIIVGGYAKNVNAGAAIQNKAFVVKYDSLGNIIWQKGFQGAATQSSPTSTPTTIEALVINQSDTTTYVGLTSDAESSIVKLDMLGNIVWQTKFDTYYGTISDMIVRANDSSLFVSGYQESNGRGYIGKINMTTGAVDFFYELQRFRTYALELSSSGNELFVGGDLFDSPLDDNFANIFKFNVTGNSFTFVSNVTVNLTGGKRYVELKRSGTSIYALGTQHASSGSMGDYSIIKYNEATLAVEASKQFYDAFFVRFVNGVGMSLDANGNVYVLGYEGDQYAPANNQLSLVKFNSSLVLQWQKTFGHPSFGDRHYNLNGIVTNGNAVYITGSTFDTYASSGLILKYPQDGSITGTFGTHVIANDSKFEGTAMHTVKSIVPSAITSLTPSTTSSVISLAQSNVSHLSFISIGGGVDYYIDLIGQLQLDGNAGNAGQVLTSNGATALPSWNTLAIPSTLDNLSDVSINSSFPLMASDVLTYHLGEWKNSQLPIATNMTTGVVKIGSGLSVDGSGLLSASGNFFLLDGEATSRQFMLRNLTSNATPTELYTDGVSTKITLANDSTCKFEIHIVARRTTADNESAAYVINGCIDRNGSAATTALVGTPTVTVIGEDIAAWNVSVTADTVNGGPRILVTGEAGKTIRWVAFVRTVEVIG